MQECKVVTLRRLINRLTCLIVALLSIYDVDKDKTVVVEFSALLTQPKAASIGIYGRQCRLVAAWCRKITQLLLITCVLKAKSIVLDKQFSCNRISG